MAVGVAQTGFSINITERQGSMFIIFPFCVADIRAARDALIRIKNNQNGKSKATQILAMNIQFHHCFLGFYALAFQKHFS